MHVLPPAVHRTIFAVDVEGFGDRRRTNPDQVAVREGLYRTLREAFAASGISWEDCYREDRGDGVLVLIAPDVPKRFVVARLPEQLCTALRRHNRACSEQVRIRLRVAVHAGEVHHDEHGVAGVAVIVAFRLLEAAAVKSALATSPGVVALIASDWFFEEVIRHDPTSNPTAYRRARVAVKETKTTAWVRVPDHHHPSSDDGDVATANDVNVQQRPDHPAAVTAECVPNEDGDRHSGLPAELTSFVGRETEVAAVKRLLSQSRLVTLTGPGGVGKTRIALRVAAEVQTAYADGVYLIELSGLQDTELLTYTVAAAVGLPEQIVRPTIDILVGYLKSRRVLLVLDTCEHIIDACATLTDDLLRGTTNLQILVTSRQPLNTAGEHILPITPMSVPAEGEEPFERTYDALTLFTDRAAAAAPGFAVTEANLPAVAAVCRRLDGIPLAIELAVVRLRALSVEQMVSLLDDRFRLLTSGSRTALARHQTLHTAISWSHELCTPEERLLWAQLSVFAGDFDLAAAQQICAGGDLSVHRVLEDLVNLVDKSIVVRVEGGSGTRYRLLDTICEYGRERLVTLGEEHEFRRRHRDYYLAMAEQFDAEWMNSAQVSWVQRLNSELPNLRVALEFCLTEPGEAKAGLTLATTLWGYWLCSARLSEGRYWIDRGLQLLPDATPLRARALWLTGWFTILQGEHLAGEQLFEESRAIAEQIGDDSAFAYATQYLGNAYLFQEGGQRGPAMYRGLALYEDALARLRKLKDRRGVAILLFQLGSFYMEAGDVDRGLAACDESLRLNRNNDERWCRSYALHVKSIGFWLRDEYRKSARLTSASLRMKHELGDLLGVALSLEMLAWIAAKQDRYQQTALLLGAAHVLWQKIGCNLFDMKFLWDYHDVAEQRARQALGQDGYAEIFQAGTTLTLDQAVNRAIEDEGEEL